MVMSSLVATRHGLAWVVGLACLAAAVSGSAGTAASDVVPSQRLRHSPTDDHHPRTTTTTTSESETTTTTTTTTSKAFLPVAGSSSVSSAEFVAASSWRRRLQQRNVYEGAKQKISEVNPIRLGVTTCLIMCLGSLAAGAGIGGGGLFVPIYWLVLDVGPKAAVPLSTATILGGAIGNFVSIGWQKHPRANRPLIDYEAAVFTQPGELLGVVFGVLLNIILPKVAIVGLLALVLSYNSRRTIKKALRTRAKETAAFAAAAVDAQKGGAGHNEPGVGAASAGGHDVELEGGKLVDEDDDDARDGTSPSSGVSNGDASKAGSSSSSSSSSLELTDVRMHRTLSSTQERKEDVDELKAQQKRLEDEELEGVLAMDAVQFPIWAYAILLPMTIYLVVYKLLSGTVFGPCARWDLTERDGEPKGYAGGIYWLWYWTPVPVFASFWIVVAKIIKARSDRRRACKKYVPLENDLVWDEKFMRQFPAYALAAGCASGLLGIGGGMILGPIFMAVNMEPRCATSASAFSILWTAGSSTILWLFGGNLGWQLLVWMMGWGFVSGQLGQRMVDRVLKKTGRPSYVIMLLGVIIATACVSMTISGIVTISLEAHNGKPIIYLQTAEFKCGKSI